MLKEYVFCLFEFFFKSYCEYIKCIHFSYYNMAGTRQPMVFLSWSRVLPSMGSTVLWYKA